MLELQLVINARGVFAAEVADHNQRLVRAADKGLDDDFGAKAAPLIKSVEGLVKNQQLVIFDEGAGKQA